MKKGNGETTEGIELPIQERINKVKRRQEIRENVRKHQINLR